MSFRKKYKSILHYDPDLLIIQECEHPDNIIFDNLKRPIIGSLWIGDNKHKGLAIFSFTKEIDIANFYNSDHKYVLPFLFNKQHIIAVWAMNNRFSPKNRYIAQVWSALNEYESVLNDPMIIIGDFNSNKIWDNDKPKRIANHSQFVDYLNNFNIISAYHKFHNEDQGNESIKSFYMHRNENKGYHIDYCFLSNSLFNKLTHFEIGAYSEWNMLSDHCPLIIDIRDQ